MKRFLVVGCGGSGGATLQYLMDQLRADLGRDGLDLPGGWQFVHIDVPVKSDGVGGGMPPTVEEQGGRYVALAPPGATYAGVSRSVEQRLQDAGQLAQISTFRPDPAQITFPIADGAGQYRGVGRMLTVSQAPAMLERLQAAFSALDPQTAREGVRRVAEKLSPATVDQVDTKPVVLIVSSMAGGAGASMVLDVCRVLATMYPNYDPLGTALFLFTPEVFSSLPEKDRRGVDGNAMAMMGELLAAQAGAGASGDAAVLRAMGLSAPDQAGLPFGRVFPIGLKIGGTGGTFGDGSTRGVYRGLGRGLAALMLSGQASSEFAGFDIPNPSPPPTEQQDFGWGTSMRAWQWGSFGYASLGLGRERYGEYAAQRLARLVVDRLVDGYLQPQDPRPASEQLRTLGEARWPGFCADGGLPPPGQPVISWLRPLINGPLGGRLDDAMRDTVDTTLADGHGSDLTGWLPSALQKVANSGRLLRERADAAAYQWAFAWHEQVRRSLEEAVLRTATASGLPAARDLLQRVATATTAWVTELQVEAGRAPSNLGAAPEEARGLTGGKGRITVNPEIAERLRRGFRNQIWLGMQGHSAVYAADVLLSLSRDLVVPLIEACDDGLALLLNARTQRDADSGVARVETDFVTSWPGSGSGVDRRFSQAHNEVLLTRADDFPVRFDAHVHATYSDRSPDGALRQIVEEILSGRWSTPGNRFEEPVLERLATWRPGVLGRDPGAPDAVASPMIRAKYRWVVQPARVLDRARRWVRTEQQPFDAFVRQSLEQYLAGAEVNEAEQATRAEELRRLFREALSLARPLVAVNVNTVSAQHAAMTPAVSYKFGALPFARQSLATQLMEDLERSAQIESTTPARFQAALVTGSPTTRIDLFGSHSNLSPVCFSSLLAPLDQHWAANGSIGSRRAFFDLRRARRLPGGLPMGDAQRRALVAGWYVARLTGRLRLPSEHHGSAVEVWDATSGEWVAFPSPLILDEEQYKTPTDVLPTVLLSSLLALAKSHQYPNLEPFRPYTVLRKTWDDGTTPRDDRDPVLGLAAAAVLRDALTGLPRPPGAPARAGAQAEADWVSRTPEERRAALVDQLTQLQEHLGRQYLPPGALSPGGGDFSVISRPDQLPRVPLVHEIAPDMHWAVGQVLKLLASLSLKPGSQLPGTLLDPALG